MEALEWEAPECGGHRVWRLQSVEALERRGPWNVEAPEREALKCRGPRAWRLPSGEASEHRGPGT